MESTSSKMDTLQRDHPAFNFTDMPKHWLNHDPYLTHMFNTPSLVAPQLEGLMTSIVSRALGEVKDTHLKSECERFLREETSHGRQHVHYNQALKAQGYTITAISHHITHALSNIKHKWSLLSLLALGVGIECFTATISEVVLSNQMLKNANPALRQFWVWHMQEELQHKAVLFDLYEALGGGYFRRVSIFTLIIFFYCFYGLKIYLSLIELDQLPRSNALRRACSRKSFFIKSLIKSLRVYRWSYHPVGKSNK